MVAIIEVSKFALSGMPNIELTSFWLIMLVLYHPVSRAMKMVANGRREEI